MRTGRMPSVDAARFAQVPRSDVPMSAFDVRHMHKTTFDSEWLVPVYIDEVLPGDRMKMKMTAFCRLSTPIVPVMDNLDLESFFFFVPNRLVWENWERFMGEKASPTDTTQFLMPYVNVVDADLFPGSLSDYFGLTLNGSVNTLTVCALPFRAYNLIWNDWFRDQDLQTPVTVLLDDGPDTVATDYPSMLQRGKRHDYFTSARPWPQKPNQGSFYPSATPFNNVGLNGGLGQGGWFRGNYSGEGVGVPVTGIGIFGSTPTTASQSIKMSGNRTGLYGDFFTTATMPLYTRASAGDFPDIRVLVNDLRTAAMVQRMLELDARGGTRYAERVRAHFGVVNPDARLQRPEYLGGGRTPITVNPVAQTSATGVSGGDTVLGELAGVGSALAADHGFSASFTEHGFIIGLVSIRSDLTYQQGVNRMWYRRTPFDIYWPGLAHLGEQAILSQEIYADGSADDVTVFGYQERWAEYKYKPSRTSGYFRSTVATPLDMWHFGQLFASRPVLNEVFIPDQPPVDRVLQTAGNFGTEFLMDAMFDCRMVRCMPMYSIPGLGPRL